MDKTQNDETANSMMISFESVYEDYSNDKNLDKIICDAVYKCYYYFFVLYIFIQFVSDNLKKIKYNKNFSPEIRAKAKEFRTKFMRLWLVLGQAGKVFDEEFVKFL